ALTASELRVARLAAAGKTNREIAQALFITTKTASTHLSHAYRKLDVTRRSQLAEALVSKTPARGGQAAPISLPADFLRPGRPQTGVGSPMAPGLPYRRLGRAGRPPAEARPSGTKAGRHDRR